MKSAMLNRFKNAVNNVVGGISSLERGISQEQGDEEEYSDPGNSGDVGPAVKFPYSRPDFLQLNSEEVQVSADHVSRPIIVPRDITRIPWCAGYAEVINAGKSKLNEDQARAETMFVRKSPKSPAVIHPGLAVPTIPQSNTFSINGDTPGGEKDGIVLPVVTAESEVSSQSQGSAQAAGDLSVPPQLTLLNPDPLVVTNSDFQDIEDDPLPFTYFAIFDGHAGTGAAIMAVQTLHNIIQDKLCQVRDLILKRRYGFDEPQVSVSDLNSNSNLKLSPAPPENGAGAPDVSPRSPVIKPYLWDKTDLITEDELVIGALESSFFKMDKIISDEKQFFKIPGGCTALVALFFLGKLYVANAGDSRAIIGRGEEVIPMSTDFTPDTERERLHLMGFLYPELLQNEFTHLEFSRRVTRRDIGQNILCKNARMKGWTLKTITPDDIKYPLIAGEGKRARLLATIGVTRGFGDHDLRVGDSTIYIKPFLTPAPEVRVYELGSYRHTENDILIMGSDGLWDVTTNEKAVSIVKSALDQFGPQEKSRYTSATQELVLNARGLLRKGWRTLDDRPASGDDITAFVIPLHRYGNQPVESSSTESAKEVT